MNKKTLDLWWNEAKTLDDTDIILYSQDQIKKILNNYFEKVQSMDTYDCPFSNREKTFSVCQSERTRINLIKLFEK